MRHIEAIVVGGGISGLTCAYALRKAGIEAEVFEGSGRAGGSIQSVRRDGYLLELGPQSFSGTLALRWLCNEIGIDGQLLQAPARAPRYVVIGGKLREVPLSPPAFLTSSLFSAVTKWSIARDVFGRSAPPAEDEPVARFVRRKFSAELLDRLVGPFVSGIYAGDAERLSLRSAFPALYEAEKSAGSVVRGMIRGKKERTEPRQKPTLLSFRDGNETLMRALSEELGAGLHCDAEATRIAVSSDGTTQAWIATFRTETGEETVSAKHLVMATPTNVAGQLLRGLQADFDTLLSEIEYAPVAVVSLGYVRARIGRSLDGFGFLVPRSEGLRVLGTVWNSSLFASRAPEGYALLTSFVGGATDTGAVALPPEQIAKMVHSEIAPLLAIGETPAFSHVQVYRHALPQYNLGHAERITSLERIRTRFPNLWFTGNYLRGPAIGACVEQSQAIAAQIAQRTGHPV